MKSWAWAAVGLLAGAGMVGNAACGSSRAGPAGARARGGSGGSASTVNPNRRGRRPGRGWTVAGLRLAPGWADACRVRHLRRGFVLRRSEEV